MSVDKESECKVEYVKHQEDNELGHQENYQGCFWCLYYEISNTVYCVWENYCDFPKKHKGKRFTTKIIFPEVVILAQEVNDYIDNGYNCKHGCYHLILTKKYSNKYEIYIDDVSQERE